MIASFVTHRLREGWRMGEREGHEEWERGEGCEEWERGRGLTNGREGLGKCKGEGRKENRWGEERGGRNEKFEGGREG